MFREEGTPLRQGLQHYWGNQEFEGEFEHD